MQFRKQIRKMLAVLLTVCMILPMLPMPVSAYGGEEMYALADGWEIKNGDSKAVINDKNQVTISTQYGNFSDKNNGTKNVFLYDVEDTDFEVSVTLDFKPAKNFQTAGLMIYKSDNELFGFVRRYHTYFETKSLCTMGVDGIYTNGLEETHEADPSAAQDRIYLKVIRKGTNLQCWYSLDQETWKQHSSDFTYESFENADLKVGFFTGDTTTTGSSDAVFSDFTLKVGDGEAVQVPVARYAKPVTGISLNKNELELVQGMKETLVAAFTPADASCKEVFWSSSNENVATVEDGEITALTAGETVITAEAADGGFTASCQLTVKRVEFPVESISLNKTSAVMELDETLQLQAAFTPENATIQDIIWSSSNQGVATVDENGFVTALYKGTAVITATSKEGRHTAECEVTVNGFSEETEWNIASPDGNVQVGLNLDEKGVLHYQAEKGGLAIVEESVIGMVTDLADFSEGLLFEKGSAIQDVNEDYTMVSGKRSEINNHYNEVSFTFRKGAARFIVELRIYNDGYAFRYTVEKIDGTTGTLVIEEETSTFALPKGSNVFAMNNNTAGTAFNHEGGFEERNSEALSGQQSMPLLNQASNGLWTLITEANLYGDTYVGSFLENIGDGELKVAVPLQQQTKMGTMLVTTEYPFTSPWRLAVSGELKDIVETDMITNVADESTIEDASWVKPGVTAWGWLSNNLTSQHDYEGIKKIVDFASEMEWSYYIMDEGWQPYNSNYVAGSNDPANRKYIGYYSWFDDLVTYAEEKNVGLIAWILAHDLDTPEELSILEDFKERGIVGIKVDFFDYDDQDTIDLYEVIYKECARLGLMINAHGANKPTGEARTYPNVINREAVPGEEYGGNYSTYQTTIWPFIRGVVGPMDVTPRVFPAGTGTTTGQNVAMLIAYESGLPCMASSYDDYRASASYTLLKGLPAAWDDIEYIDGYPGKYYSVARRSGKMWYTASITTDVRDAVLPLDFLDEGKVYDAVIYHDGATRNDMLVDYQSVTREDTLTIPMSKNGGCCVKLTEHKEENTVTDLTIDKEVTLSVGDTAAITAAITPTELEGTDIAWTTSDSQVAEVNAYGTVTGVSAGVAVITARSMENPQISAKCVVMVTGEKYVPTEGWEISSPASKASEQTITYEKEPNKITLPILTGDFGSSASARNVWIRKAPEGDFEITVKVSGGLSKNFQTVGLTAYADEVNVVSMTRRYHSWLGNNIFCMWNWNNGYIENCVSDPNHTQDAYMKLVKEGNVFTGSYSYDGENWVTIEKTITSTIVGECENLKIGVYAVSGTYGANIPVDFEDFTCNGEKISFIELKTSKNVVLTEELETVTVKENTPFAKLGLPESTVIYLDNGEKAEVPVVWNEAEYTGAPGVQKITGQLDLSGIEKAYNPDGITAVIRVLVEEAAEEHVFAEIVTQPKGTAVLKGEDAVVTFEAKGDGLTYQWFYKNPGNKKFYESGTQFVNENTYSVPMYAWRDGQEVYCIVKDIYGNQVQTDIVTLSLKKADVVIITQPENVTVEKAGDTARLTVEASGENLTYTWYYKNPGNVKFYESGAQFVNGNCYEIPVNKWRDGQEVYCVITDAAGMTVQTDIVTLRIAK